MKSIACLVIAVLFAVVLSQRPRYSLMSMNWSSQTSGPSAPVFPVATAKDLLMHTEPTHGTFTVRHRSAEGVYELTNSIVIIIPQATTNGNWVVASGEGVVGLIRVEKNNTVSTEINIVDIAGFLLSDDTYVGYNPYASNNDGIQTIKTYKYNQLNNSWVNIPSTELNVSTSINWGPDISSYRVSDTHLIIANSTSENITVEIYARQADKSWSFTESVPVNSTYSVGSVTYNDVDTFVHSIYDVMLSDNTFGIVFFYTKINGKWIEQAFTSASVGYRAVSYLGGAVKFLDANNVLVSASFEGYDGSSSATATGGKVLLFSRNADGLWEPLLDLVGSNHGFFGFGIGINDYDIIIPSIVLGSSPVLTYFTAPRCFYQPINVTCADQQVSDCSQLDVTKISLSSLYTINNAQCGNTTASLVSTNSVNTNTLEVHFSFSRDLVATVFCNVTVTCPAVPIAQSTPGTDQTPSQGSGAPIATPKSTNTVSDANVVGLGYVSLFFALVSM